MMTRKVFVPHASILFLVGLSLLVGRPRQANAATATIRHYPPVCVAVGAPVTLTAEITAPTSIQEARLYFKTQDAPAFYFVKMLPQTDHRFLATLPAPRANGLAIEYRILAAERNAAVTSSESYYTFVNTAAACVASPKSAHSSPIDVYAEQPLAAELGFTGQGVRWQTNTQAQPAYLQKVTTGTVTDQQVSGDSNQGQRSVTTGQQFDPKTMLYIGLGVGAAAGTTAFLLQPSKDQGVDWTISGPDDEAKNVDVEIIKTPDNQTTCGTPVMNQLYVKNRRKESLTIGIIEYEIALTKDKPQGSCQPGRTGTFAPNWATVIAPGERILVREWQNEVNACAHCPYVVAECQWQSLYIVHTSAGGAQAESKFTVKGNLCAAPTGRKTSEPGNLLTGDLEP